MANPFYDNSDPGQRFISGETARGGDVDAKFDEVAAGFDKADQRFKQTVSVPETDGFELPDVLTRKGKILEFDEQGKPVTQASASGIRQLEQSAQQSASQCGLLVNQAQHAAGLAQQAASDAELERQQASDQVALASQQVALAQGRVDAAAAQVALAEEQVTQAGREVASAQAEVGRASAQADRAEHEANRAQGYAQAAQNIVTPANSVKSSSAGQQLVVGDVVLVKSAGQRYPMPLSPAVGAEVTLRLGSFDDTLLGYSGNTAERIEGGSDDYLLNIPNIACTFKYFGPTEGWRLI
ncbi:hypothetical protein [Neptunomonas sp. XY-337]|uniref:hypothetical protein n=1 Tax=Neptunomonas sp. XY-337 TaxID=2561897 RepID=UPI0010A9B670|nr:hypothetical protein [Neptunomonas sp. XY-337]